MSHCIWREHNVQMLLVHFLYFVQLKPTVVAEWQAMIACCGGLVSKKAKVFL